MSATYEEYEHVLESVSRDPDANPGVFAKSVLIRAARDGVHSGLEHSIPAYQPLQQTAIEAGSVSHDDFVH